jgi:hypothetical protein
MLPIYVSNLQVYIQSLLHGQADTLLRPRILPGPNQPLATACPSWTLANEQFSGFSENMYAGSEHIAHWGDVLPKGVGGEYGENIREYKTVTGQRKT